MAIQQIDLNNYSDRIIHSTKVDFMRTMIMKPIRVVQYDNNLPIVEAELFMNGYSYTLPQSAEMKIRWGKPDHTFIIKEILGCDSTRKKVYFEVDNQMTYFSGPADPILELKVNGKTAGSSYISFNVDRNPVQDSDIASAVEYVDLDVAVARAETAASNAEAASAQASAAAAQALVDIGNAKNTAIADIGTAKDASIVDIGTAKNSAIADIGTAKDNAILDVQAAAEEAIEHIDDHLWAEVGNTGQTTPSANLAVGGVFYEKIVE